MKDLVSCSICNDPQCIDIAKLQLQLSEATNSDISDMKDYHFICEKCLDTELYKKEYFFGKTPHVALTSAAKAENNN